MEWISTKDRLPEHNQEILLVTYDEEYQCPDDAPEWWQDEDGKPLHLEEHIGVWYGLSRSNLSQKSMQKWTQNSPPDSPRSSLRPP